MRKRVAHFAKKRHRRPAPGFLWLMRRLLLAAVLVFFPVALHAQSLGPVDWIFLVDTSKSMRGVGGTKNIWGDVQASLGSFVHEAGTEDTITLYTFDRDVRQIEGDPRRTIFELAAEGNRTHLGAAIAKGLERAEQLRGDPTRRQVVVLFTDGEEDVRDIENPIRIESSLAHVGNAFVFFVSMGKHELQLDAFAANTERASVLKAPTVDAIRDVARQVRAKIPPIVVPMTTTVAPPPPPVEKKSFPVLPIAIALALLALTAFLVIRQQRKKNRLEGELEILRPSAAFVGLPALQANEVALSAILPVDALGGSDARLFVRRRAGRKKVWIAAQSGSLRINDVETPMSELYDADTIEIGEAKLRFNRVGDERPLESSQEGDL